MLLRNFNHFQGFRQSYKRAGPFRAILFICFRGPRQHEYFSLQKKCAMNWNCYLLQVDHAGEFGADKIYAGQLAVLGPKGTGSLPFVPSSGRKVPAEETGALIQHMWDQEKEHLAAFERLIPKHRARPTALLPIWNIAGVYFIYSNNIKSISSHNCRNY